MNNELEEFEKDFSGAGDPAFPNSISMGLTKREWFAGMAMQGLLSSPSLPKVKGKTADTVDELASVAFAQADAMIAEGAKE